MNPDFDIDKMDWGKPESWPKEIVQCFEVCAGLCLHGLRREGKQMLDVRIEGAEEPIVMLFARADRAEELRRAWRSVYALHNPA